MTQTTLTRKRIHAGVWEGVLATDPARTDPPALRVFHLGDALDDSAPALEPAEPGAWTVRVAIPTGRLSDGVQTFLIQDADSQETLAHFDVAVGEPLDDDIRGEVELIRAELDMLKRAFRRHCVETR